MMEFDQWMTGLEGYFVRYSDDMLLLGDNKEKLLGYLAEIRVRLGNLGLRVNESKTYCVPLENGIDMLGYHFSLEGKSIPAKAIQGLQDRLEIMWLTSPELLLEDKMKKALEIVGGWEQYFREKRKTESIFEYMALVYAAHPQEKYLDELEERRTLVLNIYKDIALYPAKIWETTGRKQMELLEYEQYYQIWNGKIQPIEKEIDELLIYYRKMMVKESDDISIEIMQSYTDRGEYEKASFWMQKSEQIQQENRVKVAGNMYHIPEDK